MNQVIPISIWPYGMINCFLIKGNQKHVLVDTGLPGSENRILSQMKRSSVTEKDISLIVITHGHIDHFGGAARLRELMNVPVLAHTLDQRSYIEGKACLDTLRTNRREWELFKYLIKDQKALGFNPDILLTRDEEYDLRPWGVEGKVIHTPGHTPGSLSVILDNGENILMDMMASGILLGGLIWKSRIKHPPFHHDWNELKASFEKVLREKGEVYYLGHGGPVGRAQVLQYCSRFLNGDKRMNSINP